MKYYKTKITRTQTSFSTNFGGKLSFIHSFLFPERLHCCCCCCIYFHCSYLYNYYNDTRLCALNAEFLHSILILNKISLLWGYHWKEGIGGEREGDFMVNFNIFYYLRTIVLKLDSKCCFIWNSYVVCLNPMSGILLKDTYFVANSMIEKTIDNFFSKKSLKF